MDTHTERNRDHFDQRAANYGSVHGKLFHRLAKEIQERRDWIAPDLLQDDDDDDDDDSETKKTMKARKEGERNVKILDYACGTGNISHALAPYATEIRGVDISTKMVEEYNRTARNQGLAPSEMSATVGNLLDRAGPSSSVSGVEFFDFDLAIIGLGLHHFEDVDLALKRLVERIRAGTGVLLIIDFLPHDHVPGRAVEETVAHDGFDRTVILDLMARAGCEKIDIVVLGTGVTFAHAGVEYEKSIFMCRGIRSK